MFALLERRVGHCEDSSRVRRGMVRKLGVHRLVGLEEAWAQRNRNLENQNR